MPKLRLIISLMAIVAVIIISIAIYIFTHLNSIDMMQGLILISIAVVGLFLIMGVILMLMKSITAKK
jgi:multisubunit Na+/H+ antiporter MnhC subunit